MKRGGPTMHELARAAAQAHPTWLDVASAVPVLVVARALNLTTGSDSRSFGPCPSCRLESRNNPDRPHDSRGRCRVTPDGGGWLCCSNGSTGCGAKGGGPALVAWALTGDKWQKGGFSTGRQVQAWYEQHAFFRGSSSLPAATAATGDLARSDVERKEARPDRTEMMALWAASVPVVEDEAVANWLAGRRDGPIDPALVAVLDLARAIPADSTSLPHWARYQGAMWSKTGHRLLCGAGAPRSQHREF